MNKPIVTPDTGEKELISLTPRGTTQYGECVVIKQEEMNGRQALVIESMRSDNAGLLELRREAKADKRMTIYLE